MLAHNFTHSQLIDAISYRCEEMVLQCGVGTHKLDTAECCNLIVATPTMTGKCYTFFGAANHTQTMEGDHLGVTIYINFTQDDQPEIDPVILDMPKFMKAGFQMTMMSNHTHPSYMVVGQSVPLLPRMYTGVEVYLTVVRDVGMKTALDWSETECIPLNKMNYRLDPEAFLNTEPNCDVGASGYCSKHICNCTIYGLDNSHDSWAPCPLNMNFQCFGIILDAMNVTRQYYNSSILQNEKKLNRNLIYQCWNKVSKGCRRLCSHYYYMHASTHLPIQDYIYQSLHDQFSLHNGSDVAVAMVYFPNLHYTEIKRWRKDIEEFMSKYLLNQINTSKYTLNSTDNDREALG
nr:uncharacterized protein LOC123746091 [Procambarus clarkii]